ncbi:MAG: hypothetical protein Fur005_32760 [Roseiflexaceae bacterium]
MPDEISPFDRTLTSDSLGYWIRRQRKAMDLTQATLGALVGCSRAMIRKIEQDERRPSPTLARRLADCFQLHGQARELFLRRARHEQTPTNLPLATQPIHAPASSTPLPAPPPLIGRASELHAIHALVMRPGLRCLTLLGVGGVGKTSLALAVAQQYRSHGAVAFVACAPIASANQLLTGIAQALGLGGSLSSAERLRHFLAHQALLLILDNMEHLVDAAADLALLVEACPHLRLLITSRTALRIQYEQIYEILPLPLPHHDATIAQLQDNPAIQLLAERIRAAGGSIDASQTTLQTLAAIAWRLDGIPLALILAAASTRLFGLAGLHHHLQEQALPAIGALRDLPERQQSLSAMVDWSLALLPTDQRQTLARLSLVRGSCSMAAAIAIDQHDPSSLMRLAALRDASLITTFQRHDQQRIGMYQVIQAALLPELHTSGELEATRSRAALWYISYGCQAEQHLSGPQRLLWMQRLAEDHHNLWAAIQWAIEAGHAPLGGLQLVIAMRQYWHLHGHYQIARQWISQALGQIQPREQPLLHIQAMVALGYLAWFQRDYRQAHAVLDQAVAQIGSLDQHAHDPIVVQKIASEAHGLLAISHLRAFDDEVAAQHDSDQAIQLASHSGDQWQIAMAHFWHSVILADLGDWASATAAAERSWQGFCAVGDRWNAGPLSILGDYAYHHGELATAQQIYQEVHLHFQEIGDRWGVAFSLRRLAEIAWQTGESTTAANIAAQSLQIWQELGDQRGIAHAQRVLQQVQAQR